LVASITVVTPVLHKLSSATDDALGDLDREIATLRERLSELETRRAKMADEN
jgi:hypothetical protein